MKLQKRKTGFTLVELMVVVVILAIIGSIGFISYTSYLEGVRDTNRMVQLKSISDILILYKTKARFPLPENKVDIYGSGEIVSYQGEFGEFLIETVNYSEEGIDPKYKNYFTYYVNSNRSYFQLLTHFEVKDEPSYSLNSTHASTPLYENLYPYSEGSKLGIILGYENDLNKPLNNISFDDFYLDSGTVEYKAVLSNKYSLVGDSNTLSGLIDSIKVGGRGYSVNSTGELIYTDLDSL